MGELSDSSPSRTTLCVLLLEESTYQVYDLAMESYAMELQQQPMMIDLIKGFAEVHDNDIILTTIIKSIGKVLDELDKLGFATEFA